MGSGSLNVIAQLVDTSGGACVNPSRVARILAAGSPPLVVHQRMSGDLLDH